MKRLLLFLLLILSVTLKPTKAQYYSDRPLEMNFEQTDFFFDPTFVNPYGTKYFSSASVLMFDQPLVDIQRNPANLSRFHRDTLPSNFFYLDMRNSREIVSNYWGGIIPCYDGYRPNYWYYYTSNRKEVTPLMSVAYLSRLPILNKSITLGITYQVITQGEGYYAIPYDIYRNMAGRDVYGVAYEGTQGYDIVDRFSGSDEMYHEGHSVNFFLAWELSDVLALGLKTSTFVFDREGSFGTSNLWTQQINYQSFWKMHEKRTQDYNHWDYSIGLNYKSNKNRVGIYTGILMGTVRQLMTRDDESMSKYGEEGTTNWSDYQSWYLSDQEWDHKGTNIYAGLQWEREIRDDLRFRFLYQFSTTKQDLILNSTIESESENEYTYSSTSYLYESESYGLVHDFRVGTGNRVITANNLSSALTCSISPKQKLRVGAIYGYRTQFTQTNERVDAFSESYYYSHWESDTDFSTWENYQKAIEEKTIKWKFDSRLRSIHIPVIYEYDINNRLNILFGINRTMNFWLIENSTLILYDYRERVNNDVTLIEHMTGESITEPRERFSIVNTNILVGIILSPSKMFSIQLLVSPGFEKSSLVNEYHSGVQVWLSMSLRL